MSDRHAVYNLIRRLWPTPIPALQHTQAPVPVEWNEKPPVESFSTEQEEIAPSDLIVWIKTDHSRKPFTVMAPYIYWKEARESSSYEVIGDEDTDGNWEYETIHVTGCEEHFKCWKTYSDPDYAAKTKDYNWRKHQFENSTLPNYRARKRGHEAITANNDMLIQNLASQYRDIWRAANRAINTQNNDELIQLIAQWWKNLNP